MWSPLARVLGLEPKLDWYKQGVAEFTPDMAQLCLRPYQRLFVPDEMMQGRFRNNMLTEEATRRLWAFTVDNFSAWRRALGKASTIIPLETKFTSMPFAPMRGELWRVPSPVFKELDNYKQNGVDFIRKRVSLAIPITTERKNILHGRSGPYVRTQETRTVDYTIDAWMYVGNPEYWNHKLVTGFKINHIKDGDKRSGRIVGNDTYMPVSFYDKPNNDLIEAYYYYSAKDYVGDN